MAVPHTPAPGLTSLSRVNRLPLVLDVVVALLTAVALPLAIVAIPNTISVVSALLPPEIAGVGILRAHGLALPVMLCTVPVAAAALRRFRSATILVAGLGLLAVADFAGGFAGSTLSVGVLRVVHGIGAGLLLPATFSACSERSGAARRVLPPIWAAALCVGLLGAQALALWPLDRVTSWRVTLQPYPMLTGAALVLAAVYLTISRVAGEASGGQASESPFVRADLLLPTGVSVGIAVLALGSTFNWPPVLIVAVASIAVMVLLALASGRRVDGHRGRVQAFVMVSVGFVVLPTVAQVTYVELGGLGGPGLSGLWRSFGVATVIAFAAAWGTAQLNEPLTSKLVTVGLVTVVAGLCAVRLLVPTATGTPLVVPFTLLTAGAAVAVTAATRLTGPRAALFGLSLCLPAVLSGFLLGTGIQVGWLRAVSMSGKVTSQAMVDGFVGALHIWALIGGFEVVLVLVLAALLGRRAAERAGAGAPVSSDPSGLLGATESPGDAAFAIPSERPVKRRPVRGDKDTVMIPVVPSPTRSPEGADGEDGDGATAR